MCVQAGLAVDRQDDQAGIDAVSRSASSCPAVVSSGAGSPAPCCWRNAWSMRGSRILMVLSTNARRNVLRPLAALRGGRQGAFGLSQGAPGFLRGERALPASGDGYGCHAPAGWRRLLLPAAGSWWSAVAGPCRRSAARRKLSSSATAMNWRNWRKSAIAISPGYGELRKTVLDISRRIRRESIRTLALARRGVPSITEEARHAHSFSNPPYRPGHRRLVGHRPGYRPAPSATGGYRIALVARDSQRLQRAAAELGGVPWMAADLSRREAVEAVAAWFGDTFQGLDVLVNNAGFTRKIAATTPLAEAEREWDALLDGNLKSAFLMSLAVLPHFAEEGGRIIHIGSIAAQTGSGSPGALVCGNQGRPAWLRRGSGAGTRFARDHGEQRGTGLHRRHPVLPGGLDPQRVAAIVGETRWAGPAGSRTSPRRWPGIGLARSGVRHRNGGVGERWLAGRQLKWRRRVTPMGVLVRLPENAGE